MMAMKPDAALFNRLELAYESSFAKELYQRQNYVLSNRATKSPVHEFIETKRAVVFGYVSPERGSALKKLDVSLMNRCKALIKRFRKSKKTSVLLFSGSQEDLEKIVKAKIFATIIRSNPRTMTDDPDLKEKTYETLLYDTKSDSWAV